MGESSEIGARRNRFGIKQLMLVVASLGAIFWAGLVAREKMFPSLGWARSLHSADARERELAATRLGIVGPEQVGIALPVLVVAMGDRDAMVASAAAQSLGRVGAVAVGMPGGRTAANVAATELTRALRHGDDLVRVRAAGGLEAIAEASSVGDPAFDLAAAVAELCAALHDPSDQVRKAALAALYPVTEVARLDPPSSLLEGLSLGGSASARANSASALAYFGRDPAKVVPPLIRAMEDPAPEVSRAALTALGQLGSDARSALPALIAFLEGDPAPTSELAAVAVEAIGSVSSGEPPAVEGVAALERALRDGGRPRRAAAMALFEMGRAATAAGPALLATVVAGSRPDGGEGFESWAARALGQVAPGTTLAVPSAEALVGALDAKSEGMRFYAVEALGKLGPAAVAALPRLRALGEGEDARTRRAAREAIELIGGGPASPSPPRR